jgi:hypothetical protein
MALADMGKSKCFRSSLDQTPSQVESTWARRAYVSEATNQQQHSSHFRDGTESRISQDGGQGLPVARQDARMEEVCSSLFLGHTNNNSRMSKEGFRHRGFLGKGVVLCCFLSYLFPFTS